ncbi:putative transcriptional regulator [Candidatus Moduliflexus flocculans]|uniref:Putative transcriptional regulator n=1 Tax=Candidatus Moduliflexus flocculans TaxID=1499966 RepID=A0A081BMY9_9BACT|nr:putative transcriptional regulator [Candidatus Moduliflexus flocculans]
MKQKKRSKLARIIALLTAKPENLRQRWLKEGVVIFVILLLIFEGFQGIRLRGFRKEASQEYLDQMLKQTERTLRILATELIEMRLNAIQRAGEQGEILLTDLDALNAKFFSKLRQLPLFPSLTIANDEGTEYLLHNNGIFWQTRFSAIGGEAVWTTRESLTTIKNTTKERIDYDPRLQAWYQGALTRDAHDIYWLVPGVFPAEDNELCLSGAIRWEWQNHSYVAALHAPFHPIMMLTAILSGNETGYLMLLDNEIPVLVSPLERPESEDSLAESARVEPPQRDERLLRPLSAFLSEWRNQDPSLPGYHAFQHDQEVWWIGVKMVTLGQQNFPVGVIIPEQAFAQDIEKERSFLMYTMIGPALLALLAFALQTVFFLRMLGKFEQQQFEPTEDKEQTLRTFLRQGESLTQEFKSTLRWNLKTGKPDKEIEIAWLKTVVAYLNTQGGKIFIGVRDDGEILGLDADNFANPDKLLLHINNLIKQHIGVEFSQYINVELHTISDLNLLLIACEPSSSPVFLKHNNEEHFYIRTGPSSVKLSLSEVLKYLSHRQAA